MKFLATAAFLASLGAALPAVELSASDLSPRQLGSSTRDDLLDGGDCPNAIFIFARGSTERGNLVRHIVKTVIPSICWLISTP